MPLIDVTYDGKMGEEVLRRLGELLPDVVREAVECPEEPSTGPLEPGDIEIRFRKKSPLDVGDLDVVIEVRTKLFEHRVRGASAVSGQSVGEHFHYLPPEVVQGSRQRHAGPTPARPAYLASS